MRISRIYIENFRNFKKLDLSLNSHAVIVGENKIGKSNLLFALRLILDPSLPDSVRQLRNEDFWDGLPRPLRKNDRIIIAVDITDYENNANLLAVLAEHIVSSEPMVSRLTYVFQPLPELEGDPRKESDYEFFIYGGDDPARRIGYDVRRRIPLDLLHALRDAEGDLASWKKSPLRPLLDAALNEINNDDLNSIAEKVHEATSEIKEIPQIQSLADQITGRLRNMVGLSHAMEMELGFSPTDPERLLRSLRLFIDDGKRSIGDASLGSANLLYLVLKLLELEQLTKQNERDHTFLGIEEPEAHLHPHLQRLVYKDLLKPRAHQTGTHEKNNAQTIILTTHSPHIVSVSPLKSIVLLKKSSDGKSSEGASTANLNLDEKEIADLERYIDVTRGEIFFAKGIILVEGDAEEFLLPILGKLNNYDFDKLGISVCSVAGTNFLPYIKLLGVAGLNMPFAVVTDYDPKDDGTGLGQDRVLKLLTGVMYVEEYQKYDKDKLLKMAPRKGFFLSDYCLEVDLFKCGQHESICQALIDLSESTAACKRAEKWLNKPKELNESEYLNDIMAIGKGRFAQRLASIITKSYCPKYIKRAITYVADKCS